MAYYVNKGETISGLTLEYDIYVNSGGTAIDTTINDRISGALFITPGGSANGATVNSGGYMRIEPDGKAKNVVENGGYVYIDDELEIGGHPNVTFKKNSFSGIVLYGKGTDVGRRASIHSGTTAIDTTVNSDGSLELIGGIANGNTVNSGGSIYVFSGTANNTVINPGGDMYVQSGTVNNTVVYHDGFLALSSGATANSTTVLSSGYLIVSSGGTANSVTVNGYGIFWIISGGSASGVIVNSSGYVGISSGGAAKDVVENGGYVYVVDELENGLPNVTFKKNAFSGVVLTRDGAGEKQMASVHSGTTATDTTVNSDGYLEVIGGIVNGNTVNSGGKMKVFSGTANSTTVNPGGHLDISSGGFANSVTVNSDGILHVLSGGTATNVVENGGDIGVYSGGTANSVTVNPGGHLEIYSGGTATNVVENGGDVYIEDGAEATLLPNTFSGLVLNGKNATVHSGTTANDTVVNSDSVLLVYSSGFANGVTVNKDGKLWIYTGGLVNGFTVSSGGELNVGAKGWITGKITFLPGAVVVPDTAGCLDFDLTQTTAGAAPLVNDLSFISNTFTFTLTVNGMQTSGTYKLAGGAAAFNQSIYVFDTRGKSLGTLTVGGKLSTPRADYTLKKSGSNLTVDVVSKMTENGPPEPYNNSLYDKKTGVNEKVTTSYGTWLSAPNDEIFIDKIGTVSEKIGGVPYSNRVGTDDPIDYGKIVLEHGAKLSFHAEATAGAKLTVYSLTPKKNGKYAKKKLQTLKLKDKDKDGVFTADSKKPLQLQVSGEYYVVLEFKDKKAEEAYYNLTLNDGDKGTVFYPLGDNTDDWGDMKTAGYGGAVDDLGVVNATNVAIDNRVIRDEWIGFGDKVDCKKFTLESAAEMNFSINAPDGPLKLSVCTLKAKTSKKGVTTYSAVTVKTITVKAGKDAWLNGLRLDAGDYFLKVQSTDVKKSTDYGVKISHSEFYTDGDKGWNNVLLDKKALHENAAYFYSNKLAGNGSIHFDKAGNSKTGASAAKFTFRGKQYGGFVGFGDELDFAKLTLAQSADVTFTVTVDPVLSFTNASTSGTLSVKGA